MKTVWQLSLRYENESPYETFLYDCEAKANLAKLRRERRFIIVPDFYSHLGENPSPQELKRARFKEDTYIKMLPDDERLDWNCYWGRPFLTVREVEVR
jgi:hypothetical protein